MNSIERYLETLRLERGILDLILGGNSSIDVRSLRLPKAEEATNFLESYGYNLDDPIDAAEVLGIYHESLQFLKKYFLKPEYFTDGALEVPNLFFELTDIRNLLQYAADRSMHQGKRRNWACAILKVMHTIAHFDKDVRNFYFSSIQQQVFDRFYKEIYNFDEKVFLGDPQKKHAIELLHFQTKPKKSRDSAIIKLLHKQENVSEDLFDQVGVRFVTKTRMDALRIIKFLCDRHVIMPFNLKPSRSHNTLVDPFLYRRIWREARNAVHKESLRSNGEVATFIENSIREHEKNIKAKQKSINPFSSENYTSIQFTARQLIKFRNPVYSDVKKLKAAIRKSEDESLQKLAERVDLAYMRREQRFFYPYEVQIMDNKSYEESQRGAASHVKYKQAQTIESMRRVLGPLMPDYLHHKHRASLK